MEIQVRGSNIRQVADRTIKWLLCAQRQLTSAELLSVVSAALCPEDASYETVKMLSPSILLEALAKLVILDQECDIFRFAHLSVREYLQGLVQFNPRECHMVILEWCLRSYTLRCLGDAPGSHASTQPKPPVELSAAKEVQLSPVVLKRLGSYAACHWVTHFRLADSRSQRDVATEPVMGDVSSCLALLETFLLHPSAPYLFWVADVEAFSEEASISIGLSPSEFTILLDTIPCEPQGPQFILCALGILPSVVSYLGRDKVAGKGFDWNMKNKRGLTPLAVALGNTDVATGDILVSFGADIEARDEGDFTKGTLLHFAILEGNITALKFLVSKGANVGATNLDEQTPLNLASKQADIAIVKLLLEEGSNIEAKDVDGLTPLLTSLRRDDPSVSRLLIESGANIEAFDTRRRWTPLHWAATSGNNAILRLLLEKHSNINARDYQNSTPIILSLEREHNTTATLLLSAGADLKLANIEDITPLQAALRVEDGPCISEYVSAPELSPPGFMSRGANATTEILRNPKLGSGVSCLHSVFLSNFRPHRRF